MNAAQRTSLGALGGYLPLDDLDESFVGSADYRGRARFWSGAYDGWLKRASPSQRRAAHKALLEAGLDVRGDGAKHDAVLSQVLGVRVEHDPEWIEAQGDAVAHFRVHDALDRVATAAIHGARLEAHLASWLRQEVTAAVAAGGTVSAVARAAGVSRPTIYRWMGEPSGNAYIDLGHWPSAGR